MKRIFILCLLAVILLSNSFCFVSFALEKPTHERLNEIIAPIINQSLINIGFKGGVQDSVNGKKIIQWIMEGGKKEDEPMYTRSLNHFHNPLKTWDSAGFKGTFKSSVIWAQDQGWLGSLFGGDWSWKKARDSFYKGLTSSSKTERDTNLADTFRAVGQVMHLVEDASVPAHTRNDAHVIAYHYELAVDKFRKSSKPEEKKIFDDAVANPITFDTSILSLPQNSLALIPIAKIFDTDKYDGSNPNITADSSIGLAEYANANFVSEGLLSANFQDFPYPRIEDTTIVEKSFSGRFGTYMRQYYKKNCCGETNEGHGYLLSAVDYLDYWRQKFPILSIGLPKIPVLDDNVYKDYASLLIPRAVGYSTGLLSYFFRGEINMVPAETGSGYMIVNNSDEDMNGTFELWYDNDKDERKLLKSWALSLGKKSLGNNKSSNIYFTLPLDAKEFCKYILVFKGQMGQEQNAVVGRIVNPEGCYLWAVLAINEWRSVYEHVWPPIVSIAFKGGKNISKQLPIYNAIKYKFAEGNPFIFGILSVEYKYIENYGSVPAVYKVDLFGINKDTSDINHLGEVLRIDNPYGYASGDFGLVWCDNLSRGLYSELSAQDLFISNDGKTVNVIGSYKKFIGWKEIWRKETPYGMGCVGYGEFESGYFNNNNRYPLGISPSRANVNVNPLNPNELFLSYNHTVYTNTDVALDYKCIADYYGGVTMCGWNGQIVWTTTYNEETKIGNTEIFSNKKNVKYTDSYPNLYRSSEVLENVTTGQPYTLNTVLERDRGISVSLKSAIDPQDTVSYSSEKGFFCPNRENKPELANSYGERYFRYITCYRYIGCLDNVAFSLKFNECFSGATDGYLAPWGEQVKDVTFWRNWREQE